MGWVNKECRGIASRSSSSVCRSSVWYKERELASSIAAKVIETWPGCSKGSGRSVDGVKKQLGQLKSTGASYHRMAQPGIND